jgi:hypothetical protein
MVTENRMKREFDMKGANVLLSFSFSWMMRSLSYRRGSLGYPKKNIILDVVGMYLYPATPNNNKH